MRRHPEAGNVDPATLPRGPGGRALCRYCSTEVSGRRRTFCSDSCVHEWRLRSDPWYLRQQVFRRDKGICTVCGVDTRKVRRLINRARKAGPEEYALTLEVLAAEGYPIKHPEKALWHAHHRVAVKDGGGLCGLENLTTVCLPCHRKQHQERTD